MEPEIKTEFYKLPVEQQLYLLDAQHDLLKSVIHARTGILPVISSLAATMLVVATFNEHLIPLTNLVRLIISVFLILIPLSLFIHNSELKIAQRKILNNITKYLGEDFSRKVKQTRYDKFIAWYPDIAIWILTVAIVVLTYLVWSCKF